MPAGVVKLSIKPVFIGWITLVTQLPMQLFFTFWCGGFFGGIAASVGLFQNTSWSAAYMIGAVAFVAIPIVAYVGKKLNYSRTEYRFYPDRLKFDEGFFSINKKVIKFRDVKETTLRKGILQRTYGLGSIYLVRPGIPIHSWPLASATFQRAGSSCAISRIPTAPLRKSGSWSTRKTHRTQRVDATG